ncbi:MAG: phosphoribosylanthranilate isomerase [Mariniblastus sp.]|nr:phosphoribosylanthranilate isomerase [Mariniblastus sp.]
MHFKTKICGVNALADARSAIESGVDAIGLNFYAPSRRSVTREQAAEITGNIDPGSVLFIGVFVNMPVAEVVETVAQVGLDAVQFHGDETVDMVDSVGRPVIRAIRVGDPESTEREIRQWADHGVAGVLLDADAGHDYGGTGKTIDWEKASRLTCQVPLILAGGLTPTNVARAIAEVTPDTVDVASGVEGETGRKETDLMREFILNARRAFDRLT